MTDRPRNAVMPGVAWQSRTNRKNGKLGSDRGSAAGDRVDFAPCGPYRRSMDGEPRQADAIVSLTARAVEMVKQIRAKERLPESHVLRLSVVGGGCSGFSYQLDFDDRVRDGDR